MNRIMNFIRKTFLDWKHKEIQNKYDLASLRSAKKLSVFLIPGANIVTGGIMSIFNICRVSRDLDIGMSSVISTYPGRHTYSKNTCFENDEQIYRFSQIINNIEGLDELFLHIPEYYVRKFYSKLSKKQIKVLRSIPNVCINILDQNIEVMPDAARIKQLYKITPHVTHSVGFQKMNTQKICNKYGLPLFYIKSYVDLERGEKKGYELKEKKILYSNDEHPMKRRILTMIQTSLPDFKLECIEKLTYNDFLKKISEAAFCLTFGEGFDGYYIQPYYAGSIGVTVYNHKFFPDQQIKTLPFVYRSYSELYHNIVDDIKKVFGSREEYEKISLNTLQYLKKAIDGEEQTRKGLMNLFSRGLPTFIPQQDEQKIEEFNDQESILTAIIFTYNHQDSIAQCIESIVNQKTSYKYEIHIWDDASIDDTSQICLEYAKKYPDKIDLIIQDTNTFLSAYDKIQSYSAIKKISTKYFCIIDGDDMWLDENKLQIALDFLEQNPEYVGFGHDTIERNLFSNYSKSYIHEILKCEVNNPIKLDAKSPFILTSSRIFRNIGYDKIGVLPIDYLLYYYHLAHGPIYFYDKIMALYTIGKSSTFAASSYQIIKDANCMFAAKLSKLFNYQQDKFCTDLLEHFVKQHYKNNTRYHLLCFLKKACGTKLGWELWIKILYARKYGPESQNINYIYSHQDAKSRSDSRVKK